MAKAGQPTKYRPEYCEKIIAHMAKGHSMTSFAGLVGIGRRTLDNWAKANPEFDEAVDVGKCKALLHWEGLALKSAAGEGSGKASAHLVIFGLNNMGGDTWSKAAKVEHTGSDGGPIKSETAVVILPSNGRN